MGNAIFGSKEDTEDSNEDLEEVPKMKILKR